MRRRGFDLAEHNGHMPRITEPTLAEHRASRVAAIIEAGESVLRSDGLAAVTPRSVCEKAGLARTSFYDYFATRDDLLVAIAIGAIERWSADIGEIVAQAEPGLPALKAYIEATMRMTAEGNHDIASALREADLAPSKMDDLMILHDVILRPLMTVLNSLNLHSQEHALALLEGLLNAGVGLVTRGADPEEVSAAVFHAATQGFIG